MALGKAGVIEAPGNAPVPEPSLPEGQQTLPEPTGEREYRKKDHHHAQYRAKHRHGRIQRPAQRQKSPATPVSSPPKDA